MAEGTDGSINRVGGSARGKDCYCWLLHRQGCSVGVDEAKGPGGKTTTLWDEDIEVNTSYFIETPSWSVCPGIILPAALLISL